MPNDECQSVIEKSKPTSKHLSKAYQKRQNLQPTMEALL